MGYRRIIRINFTNKEGTLIYCDLCDTSLDLPDPEISIVSGTEQPVIRTVEEDGKFKGIKSQSLTIRFLSEADVNLSDFLDVDDGYWYVNCYHTSDTDANNLFKGFVILTGIEQPFMPDPNVIQLYATDNLGVLKDLVFVAKAGTHIRGEYSIAYILAQALFQTGMNLPINVINNIMEEDTPTEPFYDTAFLNIKSFEDEIELSEDCYKVVEDILGDDSRVFMYKGEWWIVRLDEYSSSGMYRHIFSNNGVLLSSEAIATWNKTIGNGEAIQFINEDCIVTSERPCNWIKETFDYEFPLEIIDNIDFSQGDLNGVISLPATYTAYNCNHWTAKERTSGSGSVESNSSLYTFYIVRKHENGYEKERYLEITSPSSAGVRYIKSDSYIPFVEKDKINVGIDFRWDSNPNRNGIWNQPILTVELVHSGGDRYQLQNDGKWIVANGLPGAVLVASWEPNLQDETEWQSISCESEPAPVSGKVYIWIHAANRDASTSFDNVKMNYQALRIEHLAHINGSYRKYKSQSNKITQASGMYKASRSSDVKVSEAPRVNMKGALLKESGGEYVGIERVYNGAVFPGGLPTDEFLNSYSKTQAFAVWNQYNRTHRIFKASALGLGTDMPSLIHVFEINETTDNTTNKDFILLGYEQDLKSCQWTLTLAEVYDTVIGRSYDDDHEFKYVIE
jgi:hypothetical protein